MLIFLLDNIVKSVYIMRTQTIFLQLFTSKSILTRQAIIIYFIVKH